ncbi:MAG: serine/threonine protein kinase [Polyangiaceae bacterium]|nr:serine/threonine protein kinase [Polyangiaceae bacterium]
MSAQPERGTIVGGRYRLESVLGEGGMAVVWRAIHTNMDRPVALKLVRREFVKDEQVREMFVREARVGTRIGKNAHIVDFLDADVDEQLGVPFLAMELLSGEGLDARIKREGPLGAALVASVLEQLADALDQAHSAGVFHRDLKPQNLFLAKDAKQRVSLKVLDFGIAKLADTVTQSSTHVGTPAYSAPEQLGAAWQKIAEQKGKVIATQVSAATDIWALGLVAYEMLIGTPSGALWNASTLAELPVKIVLELPPIASERAGERAGSCLPASTLGSCAASTSTRRSASSPLATLSARSCPRSARSRPRRGSPRGGRPPSRRRPRRAPRRPNRRNTAHTPRRRSPPPWGRPARLRRSLPSPCLMGDRPCPPTTPLSSRAPGRTRRRRAGRGPRTRACSRGRRTTAQLCKLRPTSASTWGGTRSSSCRRSATRRATRGCPCETRRSTSRRCSRTTPSGGPRVKTASSPRSSPRAASTIARPSARSRAAASRTGSVSCSTPSARRPRSATCTSSASSIFASPRSKRATWRCRSPCDSCS